MSKSFLTELVFHLSGRIPSDAVIVIFNSIIRHALNQPLITCNPLHIIIFQNSSDFSVPMFDQRLCQFIGRSGVRHLYTVKRHIFIMIVYKDCRYIPLLNFFKQTQIRIRKCRTWTFNDQTWDVILQHTLQINRFIVQTVLGNCHINTIPLFTQGSFYAVIHLREEIFRIIAKQQSYSRPVIIYRLSFIRHICSTPSHPGDQPFFFQLLQSRSYCLPGIPELLLQTRLWWEFIHVPDHTTGDQCMCPVI